MLKKVIYLVTFLLKVKIKRSIRSLFSLKVKLKAKNDANQNQVSLHGHVSSPITHA